MALFQILNFVYWKLTETMNEIEVYKEYYIHRLGKQRYLLRFVCERVMKTIENFSELVTKSQKERGVILPPSHYIWKRWKQIAFTLREITWPTPAVNNELYGIFCNPKCQENKKTLRMKVQIAIRFNVTSNQIVSLQMQRIKMSWERSLFGTKAAAQFTSRRTQTTPKTNYSSCRLVWRNSSTGVFHNTDVSKYSCCFFILL